MAPSGSLRRHRAIVSASQTRDAAMRPAMAQPTTLRENRPGTTAR